MSRAALRHLIRRRPAARLLDVGTGAADVPLYLRSAAAGWGCDLTVVCTDNRPEVLAAATSLDPRLDGDGVTLQVADGRALPWPDGTFDVAHASLVLHHLEPSEAIGFLGELQRVSRRGVIVNDLARGRQWWALAWLGTRLMTRNVLTRHDAPLSVRRAYTVPEAAALLRLAGLEPVFEARGLFGHRFAIAAVPAAATNGASKGSGA